MQQPYGETPHPWLPGGPGIGIQVEPYESALAVWPSGQHPNGLCEQDGVITVGVDDLISLSLS